MHDPEIDTQILRIMSGHLRMVALMLGAREMFNKSYFSLSDIERRSLQSSEQYLLAEQLGWLIPENLLAPQWRMPSGPTGHES